MTQLPVGQTCHQVFFYRLNIIQGYQNKSVKVGMRNLQCNHSSCSNIYVALFDCVNWYIKNLAKECCNQLFFSKPLICDDPASSWADLPPSDLLNFIDFLFLLSQIKLQLILQDFKPGGLLWTLFYVNLFLTQFLMVWFLCSKFY